MQSSTFLVSLQILIQFLQILREVIIKLQMNAVYVVYANKMVEGVVSILKSMRRSTTKFTKQLSEASKLGRLLHGNEFQLTISRLTDRQAHRSNTPSTTPEEYYRISIYNESLSHIIAELKERFINNPS